MPNLEAIPEVLYRPDWPYNFEFDNLPLKNILFRQTLLNQATNINSDSLRLAKGTTGSVGVRIDQAHEENGDLRTTAVDAAAHAIGSHTDGEYDGVDYVRMLASERDKLALITSEATDLALRFEKVGPSETPILFSSGVLPFDDSATITWRLSSGGTLYADSTFPSEAAHRHYYDLNPVDVSPTSPSLARTTYKVNTEATPFMEDSLRVYINGVRLGSDDDVYIPNIPPDGEYRLIRATPSHLTGRFTLSQQIAIDDVIRVDFDLSVS